MLSKIFHRLKFFFYELNLFRNADVINNVHKIRNQYISTRIFLILFTSILLIFLVYLFSTRVTIIKTTESPTEFLFEQLSSKYDESLQCPCSNLSIPYRTFISLESIFHPICSINFELIINNLFNYTESLSNNDDFRFTGALQIRLLTLLCSSVDEIIKAHLIDFNSTLFTNILLVKQSNLENQVKELINQFIQTVISQFINSLKMIRINNFGSQLVSGVRTNYQIWGHNNHTDVIGTSDYPKYWTFSAYSKKYNGSCDCTTSFLCTSPALIYDNNEIFNVNGFRIGCFILESLLASSLECFYNSTCLNKFLKYIKLNSSFILLPSNKFKKTDSIEILLNSLMVEQWKNSTDYNAYFNACEVKSCSYSVESHRSFLSIITAILSFIGGLKTILAFVIPIIVAFARQKKRSKRSSNQGMIRRFRRLFNRQKLMKQIRLINLFKSLDSRTEIDIRNEFLSTRIYIILLGIIFSLLIEYHRLLINTIEVTISSPSFDTIINKNESSMICPCSIINIPFKRFTLIKPIYHPICSSNFINEIWLNRINTTNNNDDDHQNLKIRFRLLSLFCEFAQETLESYLRQFGDSYLLSTELLSENQFETQINVIIEQIIAKACSTFASSLHLAINTTTINKLISTDTMFRPNAAHMKYSQGTKEDSWHTYILYGFDIKNQLCSICVSCSPCSFSDKFGNITINEFYTNFDAIQTLLNSSFISFYNISIIKLLNDFLGNTSLYEPLNFPIIYSTNATIEYILNTLMLDTYSINKSYKSYFNTCYPKRCVYNKLTRENPIDIFLVAIGLIGGLTGILHVFIWHLIRLIFKQRSRNIEQKTCMNLFIYLRKQIRTLNIFRYSGDLERNEIISTRIYLLLFLIILLIFIFYTTITSKTVSKTDGQPTYDEFILLDNKNLSNLICSCSNLATKYQKFVLFKPEFHKICSSVFVNNEFLNLFLTDVWEIPITDNLHRFLWHIFTTIKIFCDLSLKTVEEQINVFLSTRFVSNQAMNEQKFNEQIEIIIQSMIQTIQKQTTIPIKLIRDTTYSNQIISNLFNNLNWENFNPLNFSISKYQTIGLTNYRHENCNCLISQSCVQPALFEKDLQPTFSFEGFYIGCYILESVLRSSMKCLYSQICINRTILIDKLKEPKNIKSFPYSLNITKNSLYTENTTFSQLLNKLMIESWNPILSHQSYYKSCKPSECTYSLAVRRDLSYIITILFGIIGGVNQVLRFIIPRLVSIIMKYINRNRISSTVNH